jgi:hypothetical protein
MVLDVTTGDL